ncbi:LLM class flavin-dependent oxidoreductase [Paenibacillus validus]|uniref:MsnO8 family LLM class oxidoreductase n=1 Tax=Paenibacillus validus TaxID=44253 RepID=A0A7X2ZBZ8_9BACL|nr:MULTISPECIES: LLM class flavin-dependent oxidoreductase [Paenibacillus]MED4599399.1 LLM class flavin-dependent oxidoreductase [Paenibacillus validus]MED4605111.1 LLM class flavin-dependent oxidoreductase [Paenibacillus validus]MUG72034.1 MsnO8 family LLM class oxidoreductase [Paenibacillus validus]
MKLGILDQCQVGEGQTAADALKETTRLAQEADRLGYARYWVSEHHGSRMLAFSSPEVLIAHLAAATSRIRVGSGGVMLPHYSSYKVAENFKLLEALHPNRIDLGLGRAPGGMPLATRALQEHKYVDTDRYPQQVADLTGFLYESLPPDHPYAKLQAAPSIATAPDLWLLGSSDESAKIAAQQGTAYGFAQFFGAPGGEAAIRYYREHFQPSSLNDRPRALAAVLVVCADTEDEANRLATSSDLFFLRLGSGLDQHAFPSVQTAMDYPYTEYDLLRIRGARERRFVGTPDRVKAQLLDFAERYGTDELMIVSPIHNFGARVHSYRLLADAFGLPQTP